MDAVPVSGHRLNFRSFLLEKEEEDEEVFARVRDEGADSLRICGRFEDVTE